MTDQSGGVPGAIPVTTLRRPGPQCDLLAGWLALTRWLGLDQAYLLESPAGPAADARYHLLGFGKLLTVSVTRGEVTAEGVPAVREPVWQRVRPLLKRAGTRWRLGRPADLWRVLRAVRSSFQATGSATRFQFGFFCFFGYDTARYIEELPYLIDQPPEFPDVQLILYQGCLTVDRATGRRELVTHQAPGWPALDPDQVAGLLAGQDQLPAVPGPVPAAGTADDTTRDQYLARVDKCLRHIAIGDIYQVQIGHELTIRSAADPVHVYRRLRERNASPYLYLAPLGAHTVVGASPELFVRVEAGQVVMRPIAGTAPRGTVPDQTTAARLRADPKEIAEHVMLVDLCRNDLGRICRRGSLDVPERLVIENYSHVIHLVSTVVSQAAQDRDGFDIVAALFPAGTMTGAPKIRAMEIIEEQESSRRGLYAGALGLLDVGGYLNLALCIRTLVHHAGEYRTRASAGIVADSVPAREWQETLAKSSAAYWAVTGRELA